MTTTFYLFSNLFHIYAMYMFSNTFFEKKKLNKLSETMLYLLYYVLNSCAYLFYQNWILNIFSNIIPYLGITLLYKSNICRKITAVVTSCVMAIVCDTIAVAFSGFLKINSMFFDQGFVSNIIFLASINLITHLFFRKNDLYDSMPIMYYITVIFVPLGSIIIGYFVAKRLDAISLITSVIILLINIDVFYMYDSLIDMFSSKQEKNLIQNQNEAYQNQLRLMQQSQMTMRCLKHDMNNHILKMQDLLVNEKYTELKNYLFDTKQYIDSDNRIIDSGNEFVDSILNYKLNRLYSMNVDSDFDVSIPSSLGISSFDMNVIISNLVDNSLEALELLSDTEEKKISIKISYKQGYVKIVIGNTFDGILPNKVNTKKQDHINHGIGLKSVERVAEKYGGILKTEIYDKWFEASVLIYEK